MSTEIEKKLCLKHNLDITAEDEKYLCIKCLIEKINIQNIALVEETKIMIKQMKSEQTKRRIENFRQIQSEVKELKLSINNIIDKVQSNIDQKLNQIEKELQESESKPQISSFEENVKILSKNYKGSFSFEVPKESEKRIDDNSYIGSIQQQLESITKSQKRVKFEDSNQEVMQIQLLKKKEENSQKTPTLKIQWNKHGKEFIMLNLICENTQFSRLACVKCIKSNDPIKYTTLSDASFRWNEFMGEISDQVKRFQNQRCLRSQSIIEVLEDIKEKYNSTIQKIINKIKTRQQVFSYNETDEFNENIIYEMNPEQIKQLIETLSQNDMFQALTEKQYNIQKEDINQQYSITKNLGELLLSDLKSTEEINKIFYEQNLNILQKKDFLQEVGNFQYQKSIAYLNLQLQHFQMYQNILQKALSQQELIVQAINNISIELKELQLQKFNQQFSNFDKDQYLMKKITQFDQLEVELKQIKQEKDY